MRKPSDKIASFSENLRGKTYEELVKRQKELESKIGDMVLDEDLITELAILDDIMASLKAKDKKDKKD